LRSSDRRPTTAIRSCRVLIFFVPRRRDSVIERCLGLRLEATFCCG
jgi:hypothetical protein